MKPLSEKEYIAALEKLKRSPRDRIGIFGELGVTGIGAVAGAAASGPAATAAGAATLAGSSTLASILGGVFVTTTPIGWVIGSVVAGAGIGYAAAKLVRSGGKCDVYRTYSIRELEQRIKEIRLEADGTKSFEGKFQRAVTGIQHLVVNGRLSQTKATELIVGIQQKKIDFGDAFEVIEALSIVQ